MEYKIIGYVLIGLLALYLGVRLLGQYAFRKLVQAELDHVVTSDDYKVKGRYE